MIYLEVIELRATHGDLQEVEAVLGNLGRETAHPECGVTIGIFRHQNLDSDFAIHLMRETEEQAEAESSLGIRTAELLRQYGLVNYTIWYR